MNNYKFTLTENERNKLTVFLIQHKDEVLESAELWKQLSTEEKWSEEQVKTFKSNAEYYKEMFNTLENIQKKLDGYTPS